MRIVRCPRCRASVEWETTPHRPFCSERCRLLDLEGWASERFRIPGDPAPLDDDAGDDAS